MVIIVGNEMVWSNNNGGPGKFTAAARFGIGSLIAPFWCGHVLASPCNCASRSRMTGWKTGGGHDDIQNRAVQSERVDYRVPAVRAATELYLGRLSVRGPGAAAGG